MKRSNLFIALSFLLSSCCTNKLQAQPTPVTDTLQWLQVHVEQQASYYTGKPFQVLLDTLNAYGLDAALLDYTSPIISDDAPAHTYPGDTIRTNHFIIYLGERYGGGIKQQMHDANPNVNTHLPYIYLEFTQQIPFPKTMVMSSTTGHRWTPQVASLCSPYILQTITVGEY